VTTAIVPCVSGGQEEHGHLEEFRTDPIASMHRVREECGDFGIFHLAHKKVVLSSGAQTGEFFFRASDEDLDQAEAYPFMTAQHRRAPTTRFSVLLRAYEFEMAQPADTYRNDHSKMVVQLERPAKVRHRKRIRL
jgi:hypothetical protein